MESIYHHSPYVTTIKVYLQSTLLTKAITVLFKAHVEQNEFLIQVNTANMSVIMSSHKEAIKDASL